MVSLVLGTSIYISQKRCIQLPRFINNYTNDFLILPIVLTICLFVLQKIRQDNSFTISIAIIIYMVLFYTVFFEIIMPKVSERYTADTLDFLMYSLGGLWFWYLQRKSIYKNKNLEG